MGGVGEYASSLRLGDDLFKFGVDLFKVCVLRIICGVSLVSKMRSLMTESSTVPRGARNPFLVGGALLGMISPDTRQEKIFHYQTKYFTIPKH